MTYPKNESKQTDEITHTGGEIEIQNYYPEIIPQSQLDMNLIRQALTVNHLETTREGYQKDLINFFLFVTAGTEFWRIEASKRRSVRKDAVKARLSQLAAEFIQLPRVQAISHLASYREAQKGTGIQSATINRRLSAVRSMVDQARKLELINWGLGEVEGVKVTPYRDTAGVNVAEFRRILSAIDASTLLGARNHAILMLLWTTAIRRKEASDLIVRHFDSKRSRLSILGKGNSQRDWIDLSDRTVAALNHWLEMRGDYSTSDPLFIALDRAHYGHKLTGKSIYQVVKDAAETAGVSNSFSPHKVRHSSITAFLDASGSDLRAAQALSRHSSIEILKRYDDNREQLQKGASNTLDRLIDRPVETDISQPEIDL